MTARNERPEPEDRDGEGMVRERQVQVHAGERVDEPGDRGRDLAREVKRVDQLAVQRQEVGEGVLELRQIACPADGRDELGLRARDLLDARQRLLEGGEVGGLHLVRRERHDVRRTDQRLVQGEQDRQLEDDRQAARGGVDAVLLVERLVSSWILVRLPLCFRCTSRMSGCIRCISFCERICWMKSGARMVRMTMVKTMIARAKSLKMQVVEGDEQVEEGKEEDVPRRGEVLDPEEACGERGRHDCRRYLANRVIAARVERMTAGDAANAHP